MSGERASVAVRLAAVVEALGGELLGDGEIVLHGIAPLDTAGPADLSFLSHTKYQSQLKTTQAACVIVNAATAEAARTRSAQAVGGDCACIVTDNPYLYFARATQLWRRLRDPQRPAGIHPSAVVDAQAHVDPTAHIGPLCVVERGAVIGAHTVLSSRVTVGFDCRIGARCIVHPGVVIGADGFGFAPRADRSWEKIEQLGAVRIGDDVEIGANTCIDRGALADTVIDDGVKLDNLIQIGHNVHVGAHSAFAGCVGIAGSATIGRHVQLGGGAIVLGHLNVADDVVIHSSSTVTRSIRKPGLYTGMFPLDDNDTWEKNAVTLKQLHRLRERVRGLEQSLSTVTADTPKDPTP